MKSTPRFAICVDNSEYPASLELHKIYRVLPDKDAQADGDMRIIDESGEDYLFPACPACTCLSWRPGQGGAGTGGAGRANLCHAHSDATAVRTLYSRLVKDGMED